MKSLFVLLFLSVPMVAMAEIASVSYTQDASNISKGTLSTDRLLIGSASNTVAAGDDTRFETISVGKPNVTPSDDRALIWIE